MLTRFAFFALFVGGAVGLGLACDPAPVCSSSNCSGCCDYRASNAGQLTQELARVLSRVQR